MAKIMTLVCSVAISAVMAAPGRVPDGESQKTSGAISVPAGTSPIIDGTITPEEWQGARRELFSDGSELLLLRHGEDLYLGIRALGEGMIAANVFTEFGDGISIYHASAALGTAVFRKDGKDWRLVRDFVWRCRRTDGGKEAVDERDAFLREEGWVASNSRMGAPHELEYRIRLKTASFRLAAHFLRASEPAVKIPWPADLDDDTVNPTPGGLPPTLRFSPEKWAAIDSRTTDFPVPAAGIENITCERAREIIRDRRDDSNLVILDFRPKEMFEAAHIRDAVYHDVFLPDIDDWLKALEKKKLYLIYCTLGYRSGIALEKMKGMGFANILHMNEGIARWKQLGYETVIGN